MVRSLSVALLLALLAAAPAAAQTPGPTNPVPAPSAPAPTPAAPNYKAETPRPGADYYAGPSGRYLLGGTWLFRKDDADKGLSHHFMRQSSTSGWSRVTVSNARTSTARIPHSYPVTTS